MRPPSTARRLAASAIAALLLAPRAASAQSPAYDPAPAPASAPSFRPAIGGASIVFNGAGGRQVRQDGVALQLRASHRTSERFGFDVVVTWGLTDWDRGREWIDAGNRSGAWTTEKIRSVADWVGEGGDSQSLRFLGAIFAEMFLVGTYAAVPVCYVGSVGGATSHLQVDFTGNVHLAGGALDLSAEGGLGAAGLPVRFMQWDYAIGPVLGVGLEAGPIRLGARALWSPGGLNSSAAGGRSVLTASLTLGSRL